MEFCRAGGRSDDVKLRRVVLGQADAKSVSLLVPPSQVEEIFPLDQRLADPCPWLAVQATIGLHKKVEGCDKGRFEWS